MNNFDTILDQQEDEFQSPELYLAGQGKRLANYIIDRIGVYLLFILIFVVLDTEILGANDEISGIGAILIIFSVLGYWTLFEYFLGKTPGKFITRTKVVTKNGERPSLLNTLGRTLCRFIPFEPFSFLGSEVGWHDSITGTRVVNDNYQEKEIYV